MHHFVLAKLATTSIRVEGMLSGSRLETVRELVPLSGGALEE